MAMGPGPVFSPGGQSSVKFGQQRTNGFAAVKPMPGFGAPKPQQIKNTGKPMNVVSGPARPIPVKGAPTAGSASGATSSGTVGGTAGGSGASAPPLDSTALANIATYDNKVGGEVGGLQNANTQAGVAYQQLASQIAQAQQLADLKAATAANSRGGLYSSAYAQQVGNTNQSYGEKLAGALEKLNGTLDQNNIKIGTDLQGERIYADQQGIASAGRLSASAASAPIAPGTQGAQNTKPAPSTLGQPGFSVSPGSVTVGSGLLAPALASLARGGFATKRPAPIKNVGKPMNVISGPARRV